MSFESKNAPRSEVVIEKYSLLEPMLRLLDDVREFVHAAEHSVTQASRARAERIIERIGGVFGGLKAGIQEQTARLHQVADRIKERRITEQEVLRMEAEGGPVSGADVVEAAQGE